MVFLTNVLWGFLISVVGIALPGLINMTGVKVRIEKGTTAAYRFCFGAGTTIFFQAWAAVAFASFLAKNTGWLSFMKGTGVFIFLLLSVVFYFQAIKPKMPETKTKKKGKPFLFGMAIAAMNMLNIPFYFTVSTFLKASDRLMGFFPNYFFFIGGIVLGALVALFAYVRFAEWILTRATFFARHLNYFLSGLFLFLAVLQLAQMYLVN